RVEPARIHAALKNFDIPNSSIIEKSFRIVRRNVGATAIIKQPLKVAPCLRFERSKAVHSKITNHVRLIRSNDRTATPACPLLSEERHHARSPNVHEI